METRIENKSTVEEIRNRFDNDVERFSNLSTGQQATIDAALSMELITQAAAVSNPNAKNVLDIGCGAGNNTLKLLQYLNPLNCDLLDISKPIMFEINNFAFFTQCIEPLFHHSQSAVRNNNYCVTNVSKQNGISVS